MAIEKINSHEKLAKFIIKIKKTKQNKKMSFTKTAPQ